MLAEIEQTRRGLLQSDRRWNLARTLLFLVAGGMLLLGHYLVDPGQRQAGQRSSGWASK